VGKSNMLLQFAQQKFKAEHQITIGVEFGARNITLNEKIFRIQIWDTVSCLIKFLLKYRLGKKISAQLLARITKIRFVL
jgi:hypothetical protein